MANIVDLALVRLPSVNQTGIDQRVHQCTWQATTDEPLASDHVIALAQELVGVLPSGINRIPRVGEPLLVDNGQVVTGVPVGFEAFWVQLGSGRYGDGGSLALEFNASPAEDGYTRTTFITVTFRAPQPGQMESRGFLTQFRGKLANTLPLDLAAAVAGARKKAKTIIDALKPTPNPIGATLGPLNNPRVIHIEYISQEVEIRRGYRVEGNVLFGPEPIRNPLGEEVKFGIPHFRRTQVITVEQNVRTNSYAHDLNDTFTDTVNADEVSFAGQIIRPWHMRFLGAETSRVREHDGDFYRVLTFRVEVDSQPFTHVIPSYGSYYYASGTKERAQDADKDGIPIPGKEYPLNKDGFLAGDLGQQHETTILIYRPEFYNGLVDE